MQAVLETLFTYSLPELALPELAFILFHSIYEATSLSFNRHLNLAYAMAKITFPGL